MLVTDEAISDVESHWALKAIPIRVRKRGFEVAKARLLRESIGEQVALDFDELEGDDDILERIALAYEVAASEGIVDLLVPAKDEIVQARQSISQAAASRAFELRRLFSIPTEPEERIFHVLHLAALAYCGDRWADLRRWLMERAAQLDVDLTPAETWDKRVLYRLYECWLLLLRKNSWGDINRIHEIIAALRIDQATYEAESLAGDDFGKRIMALRLASLYHWAKATELLAIYVLQGTPSAVNEELDRQFEAALQAVPGSHDAPLEVLLKWLHVASRRMVAGSIWWVAGKVNSRVTKFVQSVTSAGQALFELLPPQRAALQEQGLLDQAYRAIVVDMPTSGGKTLLAQFRMLQALNQFESDRGWVAYIAPTRALVSQITRRLRRDFEPFGVQVEQLTGAVEIDAFEESLLESRDPAKSFHVLVCTPEKLQIVLRNDKAGERPLVLLVVDEAHNLEDSDRGLRIELLLATVRRECEKASFLLLMPYVPNGKELAAWLGAESGKSISLGTSAWKPNERIVGMFYAAQSEGIEKDGLFGLPTSTRAGDWRLFYETLTTSPKTMHLVGTHQVDGVRPLSVSWTKAKGLTTQAAAMAKVLSARGTSIAIATNTDHVWSMARQISQDMPALRHLPWQVSLVQRFLGAEIGDDFELVKMLGRGVAVHHAGLSDEVRSLVEWLAEERVLKVLCATTTIAQGINFPVSSVCLASFKYPYGKQMSSREFWNLAGRAGRIGQDSVGVVGIARGDEDNADVVRRFVAEATGSLVSRLIELLQQAQNNRKLQNLQEVIEQDQWRDFRCYVAHLIRDTNSIQTALAQTESLLRNTLGYTSLRSSGKSKDVEKADALLAATKNYVNSQASHKENSTLADTTGFSPEGVRTALLAMGNFEEKLTPHDWEPTSLFGGGQSALPRLIGVMMTINDIRKPFEEISSTSSMTDRRIAELASDWVTGLPIREIAQRYFQSDAVGITPALTEACRAIYRTISNAGPWGIAALSKMPTAGLDFDSLSIEEKKKINSLPSFMYHGVSTETAVLMRMNSVPRSIAEPLARLYESTNQVGSVRSARTFLRGLSIHQWEAVKPSLNAAMSGEDYREVWRRLSGEA